MRVPLIGTVALSLLLLGTVSACGDDDDGDDSNVAGSSGKGGSGGKSGSGGTGGSAAGKGGTGGASGKGGSGGGGTGGSGDMTTEDGGVDEDAGPSAIVLPLQCTVSGESAVDCTTGEFTGGTPCCTDSTSTAGYVARAVGQCGLRYTEGGLCLEKGSAGAQDDQCVQGLNQGFGNNPGCCHTGFNLCGILNPDVGCTLFDATATQEGSGTPIGMTSGSYPCTPD